MFFIRSMATPSSTSEPTATASQAADKFALGLDELMDMAMDVTRLVHSEAQALAAMPHATDAQAAEARARAVSVVAADFDRAARIVRRVVLLKRHLRQPVPDPARQAAQKRELARREIIRTVEDDIHVKLPGERGEAVRAELHERLDSLEIDDEIAHRSPRDVANEIRRDLGLLAAAGIYDYQRRTPDDVAELCARAARLPPPPRPARAAAASVTPIKPGNDPPRRAPTRPLAEDPATILLCSQLLAAGRGG